MIIASKPRLSGHRRCTNCDTHKPSDQFFLAGKEYRACHSCLLDSLGRADIKKGYRTYGLTFLDYEFMLITQENRCRICDRNFEEMSQPPHIDHCHSTGKIRGILCHFCNRGIGLLGDDLERLRSAVTYLEGFENDYSF